MLETGPRPALPACCLFRQSRNMPEKGTIGFVGFGEAAFHITKGLRDASFPHFVAYDIHTHTAGRGEKIRQRAQETGTRLVESHAELACAAEWIISAVTSDQAA